MKRTVIILIFLILFGNCLPNESSMESEEDITVPLEDCYILSLVCLQSSQDPGLCLNILGLCTN